MVPKVVGTATSLKDAQNYYLHDKNGASSADRVLFTHTENLPTNDPFLGFAVMEETAVRQSELKAAAGVSSRGRKLEKPLYIYSLSWAADETPDQEHMIAAAMETLKLLGLDKHDAILAAHGDEPHPHIHIIANRVHPETGVAAKLSKDFLKLSKWAEAYEKKHGKIRCEMRVQNNERRAKGEFVKHSRGREADYHGWRRQRLQDQFQEQIADRDALGAAHKAQREGLFVLKEHRVRNARKKISDQHAAQWNAVYEAQKGEVIALLQKQRLAIKGLKAFLRDSPKTILRREDAQRKGHLKSAFKSVTDGPRILKKLRQEHALQRKWLSEKIKDKQRPALGEINEQYRNDLAALKAKQRKERQQLERRQAEASKQRAADLKSGKLAEEYQKERLEQRRADLAREQGTPGEFNRAADPSRSKPPEKLTTDAFKEAATGKKEAPDITDDSARDKRDPAKAREEERLKRLYARFNRNAGEISRLKAKKDKHKGKGREITRKKPPDAP